MHGPSVAVWVARHRPEERLLAALALSDQAAALAAERLRARDPSAGPQEIRAFLREQAGG